jgi:alpha-mannosidase
MTQTLLCPLRLDDSKYIQLRDGAPNGLSKPAFQEALKQDFQPAKKGESIGPSCD